MLLSTKVWLAVNLHVKLCAMTVNDLIAALSNYVRSGPANGSAEVVLRAPDGETCSNIYSALDGKGMPGQHFLVIVPGAASFKMKDSMQVN